MERRTLGSGLEHLARWHMAFGGPTSPSTAQRLAQNAKTSPLKGMTSSLGILLFVNLNYYLVKGKLEEVNLPKLCFTLTKVDKLF
jgi:hypothetical protein